MRKSLFWLLYAALLSSPGWAGDIEGKVELKSKLGEHRHGTQLSSPDNSSGGVQYKGNNGPENELSNTVVFLEGPGLKCTPQLKRTSANEMIQKEKVFIPHVLAVSKGSRVWFENKDPFKHHVYSESEPGRFQLRAFTGSKDETFEQANKVEVFCGIHTKMNAYVFVAENDFFTKPEDSGKYRMRNVPAGTYKIRVWHPRGPREPSEATVTVPATGAVKLDLSL